MEAGKNRPQDAPNSFTPVSSAPSTDINDLENYIILNGKTHGSYSYPDLLVAMHRLSYDADVEQAAKTLGLSLQNTANKQDGSKYIGKINWEEALKLNLLLGNFTLTPRQFVDFIQLLKSGNVYDGRSTKLDSGKVDVILDEITTKRGPWRTEWLDAYFKNVNGQLKPQRNEPLENCVMEDSDVVRQSNIDDEVRRLFKNSGLEHLL